MDKIDSPHPNDVLFGRGGITNNHPGNKKYQRWIRKYLQLYLTANKKSKMGICQQVVNSVQSQDPPGRFLIWNSNQFKVVADERMILVKIGQAFRDAHKMMNTNMNINVNRGGEEGDNTSSISPMNRNNPIDSHHQAPYYYYYYHPNAQVAPPPAASHENNLNSTFNVTRRHQFNTTQPTTRHYYYPNVEVAPATNVMRNQSNNIPPFFKKGRDTDVPTTTKCAHDDDLLGPAISRLYPRSTAVTTCTAGSWKQAQTSSTEKMMTPYPSASSSKSSKKFALDGTTTFWKEFPDYGWFQGTVTRHNQITGLYQVTYTDGDFEELDENQIKQLLRNNPPDPNNNNNNSNKRPPSLHLQRAVGVSQRSSSAYYSASSPTPPPDTTTTNSASTAASAAATITPTGASFQDGDIMEKIIGRKEEEEKEPTSQEGLDTINNNGSGRSIDQPVVLLSDNEDDDDNNETGHKDTPASAETTTTSNQEGTTTTTRSPDEPPQQVSATQTTTCTTNNNSESGGDRSTATTRSSADEPEPEQTESNNGGNQQFNGAIRSDATSAEGESQQQAQASSGNNNTNNEVGSVGNVASTRASDEPPQKKRQRLDHQGNHHQPARMKAEGGTRPQHSKSQQQQQQQQQQSAGSKYAHLLFSHEKSDVTITCQDDQSSTPVVATSSPSATRPYCGGISVQIPAHKKVLAESSHVLKALWLADPTSNTLSFPSCPAPVVKQVLIHIYTNQTIDPTILRSYLPQFLEFTKLFGFEDLHMCAGRQAYNLLNLNNLEKILKASLSVSDGASSMMKDVCFAYIQNHAEEVLTSPRMTRLTTEDPGLWRDIVQAVLAPRRGFFALSCVKKENNEVA